MITSVRVIKIRNGRIMMLVWNYLIKSVIVMISWKPLSCASYALTGRDILSFDLTIPDLISPIVGKLQHLITHSLCVCLCVCVCVRVCVYEYYLGPASM